MGGNASIALFNDSNGQSNELFCLRGERSFGQGGCVKSSEPRVRVRDHFA
jgi:hypothetical protein